MIDHAAREGVHLSNVPLWANHLIFAAPAVLAIWRGGWRARLVGCTNGGIYLFNTLVCHVALFVFCRDFGAYLLKSGVMNLILIGATFFAAWRSTRYWTIVAASMALLSLIIDVIAHTTRWFGFWAYVSAENILAYGICVSVLWGVWTTARARRVSSPAGPAPQGR